MSSLLIVTSFGPQLGAQTGVRDAVCIWSYFSPAVEYVELSI